MAKRRKAPPARKTQAPVEEHSLLIRSAESLGRVIGVLQRQLDDATRQLARADDGDAHTSASNGNSRRKAKSNGRAQPAQTARARKRKSAAKRKRTTH